MNADIFPVTTSDRVPQAPRGWKWTLLTEVARLESGHTPSRRVPAYWEGGDVPWLSLKDIRGLGGRYVATTHDMPSQLGIENSSARVLPAGTVAFCRTASVGKVAILGCDMATSQDFANWVCGPDLLPEYLYEALRASQRQFDMDKQGSTHKTIYMPVLERFRVLLPPLTEQRRIADILDKADTIRRKRKEAIALTEELLRSTFLEMFGDPVTNPKGWPIRTLGEVADLYAGNSLPDGVEFAGQADGFLLMKVGDMNMPGNETEVSAAREWAASVPSSAIVAPVGAIVLPKRGGAIATNKKRVLMRPSALDPNLMAIAPRPVLQLDYLRQWLEGIDLAKLSNGSAIPQLNKKDLLPLELPVPSATAQLAFTACASRIRAVRLQADDALGAADSLFDSLVARAFAGELEAPR